MSKAQDVINKEASKYERTSSRQKIQVPEDVVDGLLAKFEEIGVFTISVEKLNKLVGFNSANNRRPQILESIRELWSDKTDEGMELYIGTTNQDTEYVISVREIPSDDEEKE